MHDSLILVIRISYGDFSAKQEASVYIRLVKFDKHYLLRLIGLVKCDIFDDDISSWHMSQMKCFKDENQFLWLSLDPFDEFTNKILEADNCNFGFVNFEITAFETNIHNYLNYDGFCKTRNKL